MLYQTSHSAPEPPAPVAAWALAVKSALARFKPGDAVRLYLRAAEEGAFDREQAWPLTHRALGDDAAALIQACAQFPCPMCDAGFLGCSVCEGRGANDGIACPTCRSLGAVACDFCSGSGLAGYGFFPLGVRFKIASARLQAAVGRLTHDRAPDDATTETLLAAYQQLSRHRAVLANALDMCSQDGIHSHEVLPHLVVQCWRGMAAVEVDMSQHAARIAQSALTSAAASPESGRFHEERHHLMEEEAARLAASAQDRTSRMLQCSRRGA